MARLDGDSAATAGRQDEYLMLQAVVAWIQWQVATAASAMVLWPSNNAGRAPPGSGPTTPACTNTAPARRKAEPRGQFNMPCKHPRRHETTGRNPA